MEEWMLPCLWREDARRLRESQAAGARYGLMLTAEQLESLRRQEAETLAAYGRVDFGGGILPRLIKAFCSSPYLLAEDYENVLAELQEQFYYFKSLCRDRLSDDELLTAMRRIFDAWGGGTEGLSGAEEETLRRAAEGGDFWDGEEDGNG